MVPAATAIYAFCRATYPQKFKYAVCTIPEARLFFLIGSRPYRIDSLGIIEITTQDLQCLQHKSYLDTSKMYPFEEKDLLEAVRRGNSWPVPDILRQRIKYLVEFHGILPKYQEEAVLKLF